MVKQPKKGKIQYQEDLKVTYYTLSSPNFYIVTSLTHNNTANTETTMKSWLILSE